MQAASTIRWGLLGTAAINEKLLAGARLSDALEVVAVASRDPGRAAAYANTHAIPRSHGSYEGLLADSAVHAVYISLPNSLHHPWTLRALAAGKHVLCEKPYSRRSIEVVEAFDAADAAGLVLSEAFMWRHTPQTRLLMELLPRVGDVQTIRAGFGFRLSGSTDVRLDPNLSGGSLMDVGCYCVSAARLVAGADPERVYGEAIVGPTGVDVRFTGTLRFAGDVLCEFTSGFVADHKGLDVFGSAGAIRTREPWDGIPGSFTLDDVEMPVEAANPYQLELEDVGAAIRGEKKPLLGRADALGQARTIEALYRSAQTGAPVTL